MTNVAPKKNIFGHPNGEKDPLLDAAFLDTVDYRTLLESEDRKIIVGRRGTGKSALAFQLARYWAKQENTKTLNIRPVDEDVYAIRPLLRRFGPNPNIVKTAANLLWRYALLMETLAAQKAKNLDQRLTEHQARWIGLPGGQISKIIYLCDVILPRESTAEELIGVLSKTIEFGPIATAMRSLDKPISGLTILIDNIDSGFLPDDIGVYFLAGLLHAASNVGDWFPQIRVYTFVRDNIFRAITRVDNDFARDLESHVWRLHWDEYQLFNMITTRMKVALQLQYENNQKIWDACTARDLMGKDGFRLCLRLTLYRPRDLIILMNEAYLIAKRLERDTIIDEDVTSAAIEISKNRLADLIKEYENEFVSLDFLTKQFGNRPAEVIAGEAIVIISQAIASDKAPAPVQQEFALNAEAATYLRLLYSVGFFGVLDDAQKVFVFCHDGREASKQVEDSAKLLVHPCYWIALGISEHPLSKDAAQAILDEDPIKVVSVNTEIRDKEADDLYAELDKIPLGIEGERQFELWCESILQKVFAGLLRNFKLHPDPGGTQRRDIVASNLGETPFWNMILDYYKSQQIVFEVKNYTTLGPDEFRQVIDYLHHNFGRIGFIISRDTEINPKRGSELDQIRAAYNNHEKVIIKLTANWLRKLLVDLKSPQKHNAPEHAIISHYDHYARTYVQLQSTKDYRREKKKAKK